MPLSQLHKRTVQLEIHRLEKKHWIVNQGQLDYHENVASIVIAVRL